MKDKYKKILEDSSKRIKSLPLWKQLVLNDYKTAEHIRRKLYW